MKPLVSIITPCYNFERFVSKCIESVLDQTYTNWQMIVIDDGSSDTTPRIVEEFVKRDKRVQLIKHKKNWGVEKLRESYNQGLKFCRGNLVAILEGDDFWPNYKLEKQLKDFKKKDVVMSYGDWIMTAENGQSLRVGDCRSFALNELNNMPVGSILRLFGSLNFYVMSPTVMVRKSALLEIGGFKNDHDYPFVDIPTYLTLSLKGAFHYHNAVLGYYRKHKTSSWFQFASESSSLGRDRMGQCFFNFINTHSAGLKRSNIRLNVKKIKLEQNSFMKKKERAKTITLLYHYFVFDDLDGLKRISEKIIKNRKFSSKTKFLTISILSMYPFKTLCFLLLFLNSYLRYKLNLLRWLWVT